MKTPDFQLSRLAFGTSGIMGSALTDKGRLRLLATALDHGITHFDTAPLYGQGDAETLLGKFYKQHATQITIATKFGLSPRRYHPALKAVKPVARALNRIRLNALQRKQKANKQINSDTRQPPVFPQNLELQPDSGSAKEPLKVNALTSQLELSLRKLGVDSIKLYLLHDISLSQLSDDFIRALLSAQSAGKIQHLGLATSHARALAITQHYPELSATLQVPATSFEVEQDKLSNSQTTICHSVFKHDTSWLKHWVSGHIQELEDVYQAQANKQTITIQALVNTLILQRALSKTSNGSILFSSTNPEHIIQNTTIANDPPQLLDVAIKMLSKSPSKP